MQKSRRAFIASTVLGLLAGAGGAGAQGFGSKPLELVVHTSPGGGTDVYARAVGDMLTREKLVPQGVTVSNRSGGAGAIAYNYIKSKKGDPNVMLTVATGTLLAAAARPELGLGLENYTPLALFATDPQVVVVPADSKFGSMKELIEAARREPGKIQMAITSPAGAARLLVYRLEKDVGVKFGYVAFKGGSDAVTAVAGGHVPFAAENLSEMFGFIEAKKLRVLAVTGDARLPAVPNAPTLKELGYPINVATGRAFAMPAGVPKDVAAKMEAALKKVHESAAWKDFAAKNMYENRYMGSAEFAAYLQQRRAEIQDFLTYIGIKP
jgi:putative tricarboxylic transport membrane protein